MPLYTYISSYRGALHAEQGRYSNFKGFASAALSQILDRALPGLTPTLRKELTEKAYRCDWLPTLIGLVFGKQPSHSAAATLWCSRFKQRLDPTKQRRFPP